MVILPPSLTNKVLELVSKLVVHSSITAVLTTSTAAYSPRHIYHVETIIIMDFIPPLSCPKDAPLQLAHNLDNHLQLSLMDTYQSAEETPRCLQHKSPPPHSGRPLARLCHNASILIRTGQPPVTTPIRKLRLSAFGHICRLPPGTQAIEDATF